MILIHSNYPFNLLHSEHGSVSNNALQPCISMTSLVLFELYKFRNSTREREREWSLCIDYVKWVFCFPSSVQAWHVSKSFTVCLDSACLCLIPTVSKCNSCSEVIYSAVQFFFGNLYEVCQVWKFSDTAMDPDSALSASHYSFLTLPFPCIGANLAFPVLSTGVSRIETPAL